MVSNIEVKGYRPNDFIFIKEYPNIILFKQKRTGFYECFKKSDVELYLQKHK